MQHMPHPHPYHAHPSHHAHPGRPPSRAGSLAMGLGGVLVLVGVVFAAGYLLRVQDAKAGSTTPEPAGEARATSAGASDAMREAVRAAAQAFVAGEVTLSFADKSTTRTWTALGASVDDALVDRAAARLEAAGARPGNVRFGAETSGALVPVAVDRAVAEKALLGLKVELDRGPENARLDLEQRIVHPDKPGFGIEVIGALSAIEAAARMGAGEVALEGAEIAPTVTRANLGIEDISTVISSFQTTFPVADKSRNDNLKLVASHIDGLILQPGQVFSFNKVVGDRTEKEGYKIAHVITAGEMVDGMAGGACQISTTLHGAVWFSGLDILDATVHSRPSTYVQLGLDATVAWPNVDFVFKNSFEFPVAISYKVARGVARVEILGREKPYDQVAFIREVKEEKPFDTITREDEAIGMGYMQIDQPGFPGYKLERIRQAIKNGKVVKQDKWVVNYRPVVEYVRMGVNPNPNLPKPPVKKSTMLKPAKNQSFKMVQ
jgi:vancomycin resistance protein YoaR